jgi:hypothetical protein
MLNGMGLALTASGLQSVKGLNYSKPAEQQLKVIGCY